MGYAPMFFRLLPGYTEININGTKQTEYMEETSWQFSFYFKGFWEIYTYGIFALYKSDWTVVGGFDVVKYTTKWGGEDWDVCDRLV